MQTYEDFLASKQFKAIPSGFVAKDVNPMLFPFQRVKVFAKAGPVKIESGIDYPARFSFQIGDHVAVQYLLAPRIEQED